nr:hypothetical protein [uncultured Vibrio sp.]
MIEILYNAASLLSVLTTLLLSGIYFIFHNTVMEVLTEQNGGKVMKRINVVIINPSFLLLFILSPVSSTFALVLIFIRRDTSICFFDALGFLLAVVGFVITMNSHRLDRHLLVRQLVKRPTALAP